MKVALILLTILVILGLITGIALAVFGKVAFAGVVWATTAILSCIARRIEIYRKKKNSENR